jgi:endonuclease/exonuclease/phosphatase family metal-dependent hydrolase
MVSFLFWNPAQNPTTIPIIGQLAVSYGVDALFLAECPEDIDSVIAEICVKGGDNYRILDTKPAKVRVISRLREFELLPCFVNRSGDLAIWNLVREGEKEERVLVAVVHLMSKAGGAASGDQQAVAEEISREIAEVEDMEECRNTVLLGDLNMNPFDPGMVIVTGFHAAMTKSIADRPERIWRRKKYRRFYNPMWGLFGDRTPGPPGTHYWSSSLPGNHHWHMLDQVLLRPTLIARLNKLEILSHDGHQSLVNPQGLATREHMSDHLPILLEIDI